AYTVGFGDDPHQAQPLIRHDLRTGEMQSREFGPATWPGEFVFVPRPGSTREDDGWLMGWVAHTQRGTSDFVLLNADDFLGPPQAVVHLPRLVPMGFHGNWVPLPPRGSRT